MKGHLYLDNQKVENLDLIGIKILEDYHFENDVIKLEKELSDLRIQFEDREKQLLEQLKKVDMDNKIARGMLKHGQNMQEVWRSNVWTLLLR